MNDPSNDPLPPLAKLAFFDTPEGQQPLRNKPGQMYLSDLLPQAIDDPGHPLYGQRHGGSFVTGLIDAMSKLVNAPTRAISGQLNPRSNEGMDEIREAASALTLGSAAIPGGGLRAGANLTRATGKPMGPIAQRLNAAIPADMPMRDLHERALERVFDDIAQGHLPEVAITRNFRGDLQKRLLKAYKTPAPAYEG